VQEWLAPCPCVGIGLVELDRRSCGRVSVREFAVAPRCARFFPSSFVSPPSSWMGGLGCWGSVLAYYVRRVFCPTIWRGPRAKADLDQLRLFSD